MTSKLFTAFNCFIFVSLLLIAGCNTDKSSSTDKPVDETQIALSIRFEENSEFAAVAKSAEVVVTAEDFEQIISKLTIGENTVSGAVKEVPAGKDRYIQVNVYDENEKLCYVGKTVVEVIAGEEVKASIDLYKVDETGTIIIDGNVVTDNSDSVYFTKEELTAIVKKMAKEAGVDAEKVLGLLEKTLFAEKWKKSQLAEVEKIIAVAIKELNTGEYFTVKELCVLVEKMAAEAKKDIDHVYIILKKESKLFETKWKYEQKEEVIKIIEEAVKKAKDATNTGEYFTVKELCVLVEKMAAEAKKDIDDVFSILKKEGKLFETKWKYDQKEEVVKIIAEAVKKAKDATVTDEYFTVDELNDLVKKLSDAAKVDAEKVMDVLKEGKKFYETKWKKDQEKEVVALIEAAIKEIS